MFAPFILPFMHFPHFPKSLWPSLFSVILHKIFLRKWFLFLKVKSKMIVNLSSVFYGSDDVHIMELMTIRQASDQDDDDDNNNNVGPSRSENFV